METADPWDVDDDRARDPSEQADAPLPDREHVADAVEVGVVGDHVREARADDRAHKSPPEHRLEVRSNLGSALQECGASLRIIHRDFRVGMEPRRRDAHEHRRSDQETDRDPEPVRGERERRSEPEAIQDRPADRREHQRPSENSSATARPSRIPPLTSDG